MQKQGLILVLLGLFICLSGVSGQYAPTSGYIIQQNPTPQFPVPNGVNDFVTVQSFEPTWSWIGGTPNGDSNWITVTGCGFKTHSDVVCIFDFEYTSTFARIIDDNTIVCELPVLELSDFYTLPQYARLDLLFEGGVITENTVYVGEFRWGPELEVGALSAVRGPTSGAPSISIYGEGFTDPAFAGLSFSVYFDGKLASASVTSDTVITASPPAVDELGIDALVSIVWEGNLTERRPVEVYLHAQQFYHYGPIFDGVTPGCAYLNTTRTLTITGEGFQDPLFSVSPDSPFNAAGRSQVLLEIWHTDASVATWNNANYGSTPAVPSVLQVLASVSSDTSMTFSAPNWLEGVIGATNAQVGANYGTASVDILWRQTRRLTSASAITYQVGPTYSGISYDHWHYGGGDQMCLNGCGFLDPNFHAAVLDDDLNLYVGASPVWDLSKALTISDNQICGTILPDIDCGDVIVVPKLANSIYLTAPGPLANGPGYAAFAGPQLLSVADTYSLPVPGGNIDFSGKDLAYSTSSTQNFASWSSVRISSASNTGKSTNLVGTSLDLNINNAGYGITLASSSDTGFRLTYGISTFGEAITFSISFAGTCPVGGSTVWFGPTCTAIEKSGPLSGSDSVTITGTFLDRYKTQVKLCDNFSPSNSEITTHNFYGTVSPCWEYQTTGDARGTVERYSIVSGGISFTTGPLYSSAWTMGRRNWGQLFNINVLFNSVQDDSWLSVFGSGTDFGRVSYKGNFTTCVDYDGTRHVGTDGTTACSTYASLGCGTYRFGPVLDAFTPCQGSIGPIDAFIDQVTFTGTDLADSWAGVSRSINPHLVSFGNLFGQPITSPSGTSMTTSTVWGEFATADSASSAYSRTLSSVTAFFDTCNITEVPDVTVYWGPWLAYPCPMWTDSFSNNQESCDLYGFRPTNFWDTGVTADYVNINGYGFEEQYDSSTIKCIIDGVESAAVTLSLDSSYFQCEVPPRSFGTRAKVCLSFQSFYDNSLDKHGEAYDFWDDTSSTLANSRILCVEDQVIVFAPLIVGIDSETYAGHTSGYAGTVAPASIESFDLLCYGCTNEWFVAGTDSWYQSPVGVVGGYIATSIAFDGTDTITIKVPTWVAEFNTDVSIAVQFYGYNDYAGWDLPSDEALYDFFKVWAPVTYHYGPFCGDLSISNPPIYGTSDQAVPTVNGDNLLTGAIGMSFFQDCHNFDGLCTNTSSNSLCLKPQPSNAFQYPFTISGQGDRWCTHRQAQLIMTGLNGPFTIQQSSDSQDSVNSDLSFAFTLPNRGNNIGCDTYTFSVYFPDALVSTDAQRTITCTGTLTYGYSQPTISGFYYYSDVDTIYGWGQNRQTVVTSTVNDDSFVTASYLQDAYFDSTWTLDILFGTAVVPGPTTRSGSEDYNVPDSTFGAVVSLTSRWHQASSGRSICTSTGPNFHYGPEILYGSNDECSSPQCLTSATTATTIYGRALFCCGYNRVNPANPLDSDPFQHRCGWSGISGQGSWFTSTYIVPDSYSPCTSPCGTVETVTCPTPPTNQPQAAASRLVGFGIFLGAAVSTTNGDGTVARLCTGSGNGCDLSTQSTVSGVYNRFFNFATESDANVMQVCYGPKFPAQQFHTRLSGYAPRVAQSDTDVPDEFFISYVDPCGSLTTADLGTGFDAVTLQCDYSGSDGTETTYINNDDTNCQSRVFAKLCDAPDDTLQVTFLAVSPSDGSGVDYEYSPRTFVPSSSARGSFFKETGDLILHTVSYGPVAYDYSASYNSGNTWTDVGISGALYVPLSDDYSQVQVTVLLNYLDDWLAPTPDGTPVSSPVTMWGTELAVCLFGTLDNSVPSYLLNMHQNDQPQDFQNPVPINVDAGFNNFYVDCLIPSGRFGQSGSIYVLLDPHTDSYTQFYNPQDSAFDEARAGAWHWIPYASTANSGWSAFEGLEPVTVYGYGFADYTNVVCEFGTEYALQGDIFSDNLVVCQTPPFVVPGNYPISLHFTVAQTGTCDDLFSFCDETTVVTSTALAYTFTGVTAFGPRHGPIQGNTTIHFQQSGFDFYDNIDCIFQTASGAVTVPAAVVNAGAADEDWYCVSPPVSDPQTVQVQLIGYYNTFFGAGVPYSTDLGCVYFAYGLPTITSMTPTSVSYASSGGVQIRIVGAYFNGGLDASEFSCKWQHGANPESDLPLELGASPTWPADQTYITAATRIATTQTRDGASFDTFDVVCSTPDAGFPQTGTYPFELVYSGAPTANTLSFAVTADSIALDSISPVYIADFDIPSVLTLTGSGFAGGRQTSDAHANSYLCKTTTNRGDVVAAAAFISDTEIQCISVPANLTQEFLDYYTASRKNCSSYVDPPATGNPNKKICVNPTFDFPISVSNDGGYTWSDSITLQYYHRNFQCKKTSPASSFVLSPFLLFLIPFVALLLNWF